MASCLDTELVRSTDVSSPTLPEPSSVEWSELELVSCSSQPVSPLPSYLLLSVLLMMKTLAMLHTNVSAALGCKEIWSSGHSRAETAHLEDKYQIFIYLEQPPPPPQIICLNVKLVPVKVRSFVGKIKRFI